jgi:hypothetical protein
LLVHSHPNSHLLLFHQHQPQHTAIHSLWWAINYQDIWSGITEREKATSMTHKKI